MIDLTGLGAVCWACGQPITARQKTVSFGSRIYHTGRRTCRYVALDYQEQWMAEGGRDPILGIHEPYSGVPNQAQRSILAMAARGELGCHLTRVQVAGLDDLFEVMTNPDRPDADYRWYPDPLPHGAERHVPSLVAAGLLAEPIPDHLGYQRGHYVLTNEGWATHRRYPAKQGTGGAA